MRLFKTIVINQVCPCLVFRNIFTKNIVKNQDVKVEARNDDFDKPWYNF